ncbi:MAG TPA: CocE/NonD family hydrolase [Mycobacteriales bacterium]|nr:CocE/NonD family hydrolase [Mycobacteriales bacterium]
MGKRAIATAAAGLALSGAMAPVAASANPTPAFTKTTLTFHVTVPNEAVGGTGTQQCSIIGDLYRPAEATSTHPVPAVLTTNGFTGSKDDQTAMAEVLASHGYGVLSYSGLGFGGSGCKITLDDRAHDGRAGSQLVSYLGHLPWIKHDGPDDPRVGMIGNSYGGGIQYAIAGIDHRVDAIVPMITWNNMAYSIAPNNTNLIHGVTYSHAAPGIAKQVWLPELFAAGVASVAQHGGTDPSRIAACGGFIEIVCPAVTELMLNEYFANNLYTFAAQRSVANHISDIRIPVLLMQGENDTLFDLQEAVATYCALRREGTPVKMVWQSWGHNLEVPVRGEWVQGHGMLKTYEGQRVYAWFNHYLKGEDVPTGPRFSYYRDWVSFDGHGPDTVQYAAASHFPVGHRLTLYTSGSASLVNERSEVRSGHTTYANLLGPTPLSYSEVSDVQHQRPFSDIPPTDAPGSYAHWSSAPLTHAVDVAGIPTATLHIADPTAASLIPGTELEMFVKLYDVAPDGSITLVHRLVSPVRVLDPDKPVQVQLPGIVHRFEAGHRFELVIAATDSAYRNSNVVQPVTIKTGRAKPGVLRLPVVSD